MVAEDKPSEDEPSASRASRERPVWRIPNGGKASILCSETRGNENLSPNRKSRIMSPMVPREGRTRRGVLCALRLPALAHRSAPSVPAHQGHEEDLGDQV